MWHYLQRSMTHGPFYSIVLHNAIYIIYTVTVTGPDLDSIEHVIHEYY